MKIAQTIVVEGKDDEAAVLSAVDANIICTHGFGINGKTLELIKAAYDKTGIVVFTDPDHAGRKIRERLLKSFPDALNAYLSVDQATKDSDIGIENAKPEDIVRALKTAGCDNDVILSEQSESKNLNPVTMDNLISLGLAGGAQSSALRARIGERLGIGSPNTKTFLKRLNFLGIGKEELEDAIKEAAL